MKSLEEIFEKYSGGIGGGDKGTDHSYIEVYSRYLERDKSLLEIGVYRGQSLAMWREYFTGTVVGLELEPEHIELEVPAIRCDATNPKEVEEAIGSKLFDYILDDGSHEVADQLASLRILWRNLAPGGIYIVEDIKGDGELSQLKEFAGTLGEVRVFDFRLVKRRYDDILLFISKGRGGTVG